MARKRPKSSSSSSSGSEKRANKGGQVREGRRRTGTGGRAQWYCDICGVRSTTSELFKKHMNSKQHREKADKDSDSEVIVVEDSPPEERSSSSKDHCTDCSRPFTDSGRHLREHHLELLVSCKLCRMAGYSPFHCVTWDELAKHLELTHNKEMEELKEQDLPYYAEVRPSSCLGLAMCSLCPSSQPSLWSHDGSSSRSPQLLARLEEHVASRHSWSRAAPDEGSVPRGVVLRCRACPYTTTKLAAWQEHISSCSHAPAKGAQSHR